MRFKNNILADSLFTTTAILVAFGINLLIQHVFDTQTLIPMIFVLAIFIISLKTNGYIFGIVSSRE